MKFTPRALKYSRSMERLVPRDVEQLVARGTGHDLDVGLGLGGGAQPGGGRLEALLGVGDLGGGHVRAQGLGQLPHALQRSGDLPVVDGDRDARGELGDLVLGRLGDVPQGAGAVEGRGDEHVGREGRVLLDVELVPDVADDLDLGDVHVAGLYIGLAVGRPGRPEDALDLDAVVEQGGGDAGERDDVRRDLVELHGGAAVVLERPGAGLGGGTLRRLRATAPRVVVPAGRQYGTETEGATSGEDAATGEVIGSGVGHECGCLRTGRITAGQFEGRLA
ncbi:hypothetical protein RKD18_003339 [Streptomyces phaeoluteigriseus]